MKYTTESQHTRPEANGARPPANEPGVLLFPGTPRARTDRFSRLPARVSQVGMREAGETMDAMGRLAGRVAHHLNNLLTVVGGNAAHLENELSGGEFDSELADILDACRQATELSSQLLSISGCRWSEPRVLDLPTFVSELDLGRFFSGDVLFCTDFVSTTCPVRVDPAHLKDVLTELVLNAKEAVHGHGTVRVGIELLPGMRTRSGTSTGWVQLEVSDSGPGMDQETLSSAFFPFFSTHPFSEDRGLGLSVAYAIVRQSGGTMKIFSAPGRGTTVRVWLPEVASVSLSESDETARPQPSGATHPSPATENLPSSPPSL